MNISIKYITYSFSLRDGYIYICIGMFKTIYSQIIRMLRIIGQKYVHRVGHSTRHTFKFKYKYVFFHYSSIFNTYTYINKLRYLAISIITFLMSHRIKYKKKFV